MRIALTGADGQLGQAIVETFARQHAVIPLTHDALELAHSSSVAVVVNTSADLVIHAAAYTNVDGCAREPEVAYRTNAMGTHYVALACQRLDVPMVYISTNEVFPGDQRRPYFEYDPPRPINAYGQSKLSGEQSVKDLLNRFYIVRVAWLFGGQRNFVRTVLRLAETVAPHGLTMVADEIGSPTYNYDAAAALLQLVGQPFYGIYHFVNAGHASRYDFARAVLRLGGYDHVQVHPITLSDYQRDSTPPPYSVLANTAGTAMGITLRPWQEALAAFMERAGLAKQA
ncbi:MAG: dTDP-4-dehydrorhamnose reductase [Chloroflexaceae bacterium]|nr:dTDP-4-dehydrorhamnose reductase [Chloroflexaceae bacterium]